MVFLNNKKDINEKAVEMTYTNKYSWFLFFLSIILVLLIAWGCGQNVEKFYAGDIPLPEHPRPDFERDTWINLNGDWEFMPDSLDVGEVEGWEHPDSVFTEIITVPFSWASPLSGIGRADFNVGWYARDILIPRRGEWKNKRVYLVIGASDFTTTVWLNGKPVGEHEGGYTPFEFDLTGFRKRHGIDRLVIRVEDMPVPGRLVGKQVYGPAKGIWQTAYLEARSEYFIRRIQFFPDIDHSTVRVRTYLNKACDEDLILSVAFREGVIETAAETFPAGQETFEFELPVPDPHFWTLDDPFLYEADIALDSVDETLDHVYTYFGMRSIATAKLPGSDNRYITLNNKPVYLKMALDQSYHPGGFYTFPDDDFMRGEILRAKGIGLNGLRIHIKTEIPRKLYWADRLGLLIQADIPSIDGEPDDDGRRNWEYTASQQIMRDFNHPAIFSWVLFNETWGLTTVNVNGIGVYLPKTREWVESRYYWAKNLDPTRLVEDNSPCNEDHVVTDINSWHRYLPARQWASYLDHVVENTYPGSAWNYVGEYRQTDIPMMNSECGAVWGYMYGTGDIDISYEYHIMMNEFRRRPRIAGFIFTEFHDVINEWNGYYRYDRGDKDFGLNDLCKGMTINDFHSDVYLIPGDSFDTVAAPGEQLSFPLAASFMTDVSTDDMIVETLVHGWNTFGENRVYSRGAFTFTPQPYTVMNPGTIKIRAPDEECIAVLSTTLLDQEGHTLHHNFVPFRVIAAKRGKVIAVTDTVRAAREAEKDTPATSGTGPSLPVTTTRFIRVETRGDTTTVFRIQPKYFTGSSWSVKQSAAMDSLKVWGTGTGHFTYEIPWPRGLKASQVRGIEFIAELSARQIQGKDMEGGVVVHQSISNIGSKGLDPGYSPNSYPMTDGRKHPSTVKVSLNGLDEHPVTLADDPADHRGLLSWIAQQSGSLTWRNSGATMNWRLDEAGSYGYLVRISFGPEAVARAAEEGVLRIRLAVDEASQESGGLAIYGEQFGRYPLDPTVVIMHR